MSGAVDERPAPRVLPRNIAVLCSACGYAINPPITIAGWTWEDADEAVKAGEIVCTNRRCGTVHRVPESVRKHASGEGV